MTEPGPVIRLAAPTDVEWLAKHDGHLSGELLDHKVASGEVLVAESSGEAVGLLRADWWWSRVPFVSQLFVVPESRLSGVGRSLVGGLADQARRRQAPFVFSSVTEGDEEAMRWHLRVGFRECGHIVGIDGPGSLERVFRLSSAALLSQVVE
jgi:GNAT superfamily N-acetyltransferase